MKEGKKQLIMIAKNYKNAHQPDACQAVEADQISKLRM